MYTRLGRILGFLGVSSQAVAKAAGVCPATVTKITRYNHTPKFMTRVKIANAVAQHIQANPDCLFNSTSDVTARRDGRVENKTTRK